MRLYMIEEYFFTAQHQKQKQNNTRIKEIMLYKNIHIYIACFVVGPDVIRMYVCSVSVQFPSYSVALLL